VSRLDVFVQGWRQAAADFRSLADELTEDEWQTMTACPGWRVRDVLAHLVALEEQLAGIDSSDRTAEGSSKVVTPDMTGAGVEARRDRTVPDLLADLDAALAERDQQLADDLADAQPGETPPRVPARLPWDWETLLRNRAIDMWVHGQDVRRAVGRPGGMDNVGAAVTLATFTAALPYVLGKRVRPPVGTSVVWEITGPHTATVTVGIDEDRRAVHLSEPPAKPTTRLVMDTPTFVALAAGRCDVTGEAVDGVTVEGDTELARRTLEAMAVTP
jgi:uncharacterized protein (TIGR03083 family)